MTTPLTTILETPRLVLRRLTLDDVDALAALYADLHVRAHFPDGTLTYAQTLEEVEWFVVGDPQHPELGLWATVFKETGAFIGRCELLPWTIDGREEVEVAYLLDPAYWRRGLATEAALALVAYGFEHLHLSRVICLIAAGNIASIRVAAKSGMTFEQEVVTDGYGPLLVYARTL